MNGFAGDTDWHVHIARFDYANADMHYRRDSSTDPDSLQTAGSTSDTDLNQLSGIGEYGNGSGGFQFDGKMTLVAGPRRFHGSGR